MDPTQIEMPMPILSPRLQLRPRQVGEGKILAKAIAESREQLKGWMPFALEEPCEEKTEEYCRRSAEDFKNRTNFTLSIYDRAGKVFVGSTGLHQPNWRVPSFHIGYWIHSDHAGQGLVTEAVNALSRYAFAVLKANRLEIRCDSENLRSLAVMNRLGFQREGLLRNEDVAVDGRGLRHTIVTARYDVFGLPPLDVSW